MPSLVADHRIPLDLTEASDVATLPGGRFIVVSDLEHRALIVAEDGSAAEVDLPGLGKGDSGLEAVAFDALGGKLILAAEEARTLYVHAWSGRADDAVAIPTALALELPQPDGELGKKKKKKKKGKKDRNKGVEGMIHLDAARSPAGRAGLILAKEAIPCALYFYPDDDRSAGAAASEIELDPELARVCSDFAGLAFDAAKGSLLLVSQETAVLAELELSAAAGSLSARLISSYDLVDEQDRPLKRVEGVAVDDAGAWWVLLEDDNELCRVKSRAR